MFQTILRLFFSYIFLRKNEIRIYTKNKQNIIIKFNFCGIVNRRLNVRTARLHYLPMNRKLFTIINTSINVKPYGMVEINDISVEHLIYPHLHSRIKLAHKRYRNYETMSSQISLCLLFIAVTP
jgi:hypothetical protein